MNTFNFSGEDGTFDIYFESTAPSYLELAACVQDKETMSVNNFPEPIISKAYEMFDLLRPSALVKDNQVFYKSDVCLVLNKEELEENGFETTQEHLDTLNAAQYSQLYLYMTQQPNSSDLIMQHQENIKKSLKRQKMLLNHDQPTLENPYLVRINVSDNEQLSNTYSSEEEAINAIRNSIGFGLKQLQNNGFAYLSDKISKCH